MAIITDFILLKKRAACLLLLYIFLKAMFETNSTQDLDLGGIQAREFLLEMAGQPHPYNSDENSAVRDYILQAIRDLQREYPSVVDIDDDTRSSDIFYSPHAVEYFEGSNIVVKIKGTGSADGAILVSSHFDSAPTAASASDAGVGTVTSVKLARYFAENRPWRDVIFNINNGEEEGLYGSRVFQKHKWAQNIAAFVSLKGFGTPGKTVLFRASEGDVCRAYEGRHAYTSLAGSQLLTLGLLGSETDFSVYKDLPGGPQGLELSFWGDRARYHTRLDDVAHISPSSLQSMVSDALVVVRNLAVQETFSRQKTILLFDLLGRTFATVKGRTLQWANATLLIVLLWHEKRQPIVDYAITLSIDTMATAIKILFTFSASFLSILTMRYLSPNILYSRPYFVTSLAVTTSAAVLQSLPRDLARISTGRRLLRCWYIFSLVSAPWNGISKFGPINIVCLTTASMIDDDLLSFLIAIPFPMALGLQTLFSVVMPVLRQTQPDSGSSLMVHVFIALLATSSLLPTFPYYSGLLPRAPRYVASVACLILLGSVVIHPFSEQSPLHIRFAQSLDVASGLNTVRVSGPAPYLLSAMSHAGINDFSGCTPSHVGGDVVDLFYQGEQPLNIANTDSGFLIPVSVDQIAGDSSSSSPSRRLQITISPVHSKVCSVLFSRNVSVTRIGDLTIGPPSTHPYEMLTTRLKLFRRFFNVPHNFEIDATDSSQPGGSLTMNVVCGWDDRKAMNGIPEFEKLQSLLPAWALLVNNRVASDDCPGLVNGRIDMVLI